jgi:DNA polymerase III delta prime subunit
VITSEDVVGHRNHLAAFSVDGEVLSETSAYATTRNPEWFSPQGKVRSGRRQLHAAILERSRTASDHVPTERKAIVLAGPPGVGKSTTLDEVLGRRGGLEGDRANWRVLNSDDFKDDLLLAAIADGSYEAVIKPPAVRGLEDAGEKFYPRELAALVHEESAMLARKATDQAVRAGQNVVIDGTLARESKAHALAEKLGAAGYEVDVVDVEAPREITETRVARRWRDAYVAAQSADRTDTGVPELGGRWVPASFCSSIYPPGRPERSLCQDVALAVAERHDVVRALDVYRVASQDAPAVHVERRGRVGGSGLLDAATYAARSVEQPQDPASTTASDRQAIEAHNLAHAPFAPTARYIAATPSSDPNVQAPPPATLHNSARPPSR